jgi:hypothetical protein
VAFERQGNLEWWESTEEFVGHGTDRLTEVGTADDEMEIFASAGTDQRQSETEGRTWIENHAQTYAWASHPACALSQKFKGQQSGRTTRCDLDHIVFGELGASE